MSYNQSIITTPSGITNSFYADLISQPHLLIAGASGSGKSVAIHGILAEILLRSPGASSPNSASMILIDPKRVELIDYARLPHTIAYASGFNPRRWAEVLQQAVDIMDKRYQMMEHFRHRMYQGGDLYVIIDEWAAVISNDLRGHPCELAVQRLSCEGRAAKVHLIIATQTPKAEILPTRIRCNLDWKLALRTDKASDSRIIMDRNGCENLPTYGKGYLVKPGVFELHNIPMVPQERIDRLLEYWSNPICWYRLA